jgi:hypothetical protein
MAGLIKYLSCIEGVSGEVVQKKLGISSLGEVILGYDFSWRNCTDQY